MKTCKLCGAEKPETEFHKDRQKVDGLAPYCKPCLIAKQREYASRAPRKADPAPAGFKTCQRCKSVAPIAEYHANASRHDGLDRRCKSCAYDLHKEWATKFPEKAAALQKRWRDTNPERSADHSRKKNYGIELGTYSRMLAEQGGRCAICSTTDPRGKGVFHVDHCHDTGVVRGLLCHNCNVGLGNFKHNIDFLKKAELYLLS